MVKNLESKLCNYIILRIATDEEVGKSVQCSLRNHEVFQQKAFRQNRVPKSFERMQAAATSNI